MTDVPAPKRSSAKLIIAGFGAAEVDALAALLGGGIDCAPGDGLTVVVGEQVATTLVDGSGPTMSRPQLWDPAGADQVVIVWRQPWDALPLEATAGLGRPPAADLDTLVEAWIGFHRLALELLDNHPERTAVVQADGIIVNPHDVLTTVIRRLGLEATAAATVAGNDLAAWARVTAARASGPLLRHRRADHEPVGKLLDRLPLDARLLLGELEARSHWRGRSPDVTADISLDGLVPTPRAAATSPPVVSVIVPCWNEGTMLLDAIASVRLCRGDDLELVVADDGSTDALTRRLLDQLSQRGVRIVRLDRHNASYARNQALAMTTSRYVLPLDADNLLRPGFTSAAAGILDGHPEVGVVYCDAARFGDADGRWEIGPPDIDRLVRGNYIDNCSVVRRQTLEECAGWDENTEVLADWDLWLGVAERGWRFHYLEDIGYDYRVRSDSLGGRINDPAVRDAEFRYIINKHRELWTDRAATTVLAFLHLVDTERTRADDLTRRLIEAQRNGDQLRERLVEVEQSLRDTAQLQAATAQLQATLDEAQRQAHVLSDELAVARDEITRRERAAEMARQLVAEEQGRRVEIERRWLDAQERLEGAESGRDAATNELEAVYATKTFRALKPLRRIYGGFFGRSVR